VVGLLALVLLVLRAKLHLAESRLAALEQQAIELGIDED
jgi:hypothetical protein